MVTTADRAVGWKLTENLAPAWRAAAEPVPEPPLFRWGTWGRQRPPRPCGPTTCPREDGQRGGAVAFPQAPHPWSRRATRGSRRLRHGFRGGRGCGEAPHPPPVLLLCGRGPPHRPARRGSGGSVVVVMWRRVDPDLEARASGSERGALLGERCLSCLQNGVLRQPSCRLRPPTG
jgi:hypothetical protein